VSELKRGKVKFFNYMKGFGFICEGDEDYFVHVTDIQNGDILLEDEEVEFKAVRGHKGWQAIEVTRVGPPDLSEEEGLVKFYNEDRGYGFVEREGKADVFAHFTDIVEEQRDLGLTEGDSVRFMVRRGRDGRDRAYKIQILNKEDDGS
jgi:CspA family cold shock protein